MSQNDFNIANQGFASFRGDLNSALQALASLSSGAIAPTTPYANQLWYDTATNLLKIRDEANSDWITLFEIASTGVVFSANSASDALRITQTGAGNALLVEDGANPDSTPFVVTGAGNVGIGTSNPSEKLAVIGNGTFGDATTKYNAITINGGHVNDGENDYGLTISSFEPAITLIDRSSGSGSTQLFGTNNGGLWLVGDTLNDGTIGHTANTTDFFVAKFEPINTIFYTSGAESMRINSAGNVGIGTTSPAEQLHITGNFRVGSAVMATPTGSAPIYACRAWGNFNGDAITTRASGNLSMARTATGNFTFTMATAMPDVNYSVNVSCNSIVGAAAIAVVIISTTQFSINVRRASTEAAGNPTEIFVQVVR